MARGKWCDPGQHLTLRSSGRSFRGKCRMRFITMLANMSRAKKLSGIAAFLLVGTLGLGWISSSRTADLVLKKDGIPCGACEFCIQTTLDEHGFIEIRLRTDSSGQVQIPSFLLGRKGWCNIRRDGIPIATYSEPGIERGTTVVNFTKDGVESLHQRKLFFFIKTSVSSPNYQAPLVGNTTKAEEIHQDSYRVKVENGRIDFKGFDHPSITDARPFDEYVERCKVGRYNSSLSSRCSMVADKALEELSQLIPKADDGMLVSSLRDSPDGMIDYYVARDGNWMILRELAKRRPLKFSSAVPKTIFLGDGGPCVQDLGALLDMAAEMEREASDH